MSPINSFTDNGNGHVACKKLSMQKCYAVVFKLRAVDCAEKRSREVAAEVSIGAKRS